MRKHGLRMAGLCLVAAFSVMAIVAASAQAEKGSHWNINKTSLTNNTLLPVPVATLEENHGILLSHAIGKELNILCTGLEFGEAVLKEEGGSLGKIKFTGCKILEGTTVLPACEPHTGAETGVVLTKLLKDLIVLVEGGAKEEGYDRLEPEEGANFVVIETSVKCGFGEKIPVLGKFIFQDCAEAKCEKHEGKVEKVTHLTKEGPGTELFVISKTVEHKATIDGSANVVLGGTHKGLTWSGTPA